MVSPAQLRYTVDAVLRTALDGLAAEVRDDPTARLSLLRLTAGQAVAVADRELRSLGGRDRARVVAELALTCALLHRKLAALEAAPDLSGQDLQALTAPMPPPRKD